MQTKAERMASDLFNDDYVSCMDKTMEELDPEFKSYSDLSANQGQIRLLPGIKNRIRAFIQWTKDQIHMGLEPSLSPFPVNETASLIRRAKTDLLFVKKSKTLAKSAK